MLVFTFPGQGSQRSAMGAPWVDHPSFEVVAEASAAAGRDLAALLLDAPMEELTATANAQLATFVLSLVVLDAVERLGLSPGACAGHSLGEYTALVASGALSFEDGVALVVERGDAMGHAGEDAPGTMAALLGITDDDAEAACQRAEGEVWVANYNAPGQVVIAGTAEAVPRAGELAKDLGARTASCPSRCPARSTPRSWRPPARRCARRSATSIFHTPEIPVVANVDARVHGDPAEWPGLLSAQLCSPVRWRQSLETLAGLGAHHIRRARAGRRPHRARPASLRTSRPGGGRARRPRQAHGRCGHSRRRHGAEPRTTWASTSTCPSASWSARAAASSPPSRRSRRPGPGCCRAPLAGAAPPRSSMWATWSAGSAWPRSARPSPARSSAGWPPPASGSRRASRCSGSG